MSQVHTIRLNGPWLATITSTESGSDAVEKEVRFKMPHELPVWPADPGDHQQLTLQRKFNQPTALSSEQQVWLVIDFLDRASIVEEAIDSGFVVASGFDVSLLINESPPIALQYPGRARIEMRQWLRPHNQVSLVCKPVGSHRPESAFALHAVCLEIL